MKFQGYSRPDGRVGIRNCVVVIPAIQCANELAERMAKSVLGVVALRHNFSCGFLGLDLERSKKSVIGLGANPNVYGAVVVGLNCEPVPAQLITDEINKRGGNAYCVSISDEKTYDDVLDEGIGLLKKLLSQAAQQKREPCDISKLTVAVRCGGSGAISAISSNAATGAAVDRLIGLGATAIFSETAELIGADAVMAKRCATPKVAEKLQKKIDMMLKKINDYGVDIVGSEPSYGNIKQGLTTIEEKSMGAIAKTGSTPVIDVLEYADVPQSGPGLYFMDGSSLSPQLYTGMISAGAQLQLHSFGGGFCARSKNLSTYPANIKIFPVIKIMGSTNDECARDYFDIYAGDIIRGSKSISEIGNEIFNEVIAVAEGKEPFNSREIDYYEMLQFYSEGLVM